MHIYSFYNVCTQRGVCTTHTHTYCKCNIIYIYCIVITVSYIRRIINNMLSVHYIRSFRRDAACWLYSVKISLVILLYVVKYYYTVKYCYSVVHIFTIRRYNMMRILCTHQYIFLNLYAFIKTEKHFIGLRRMIRKYLQPCTLQ